MLQALVLTACASSSAAISNSVTLLFSSNNDEIDRTPLDPNKRYLRVTVDGRMALMVLGYLVPDQNGEIEVWYSAKGEVIQIQQGRIIKTAGLSTDWREVRYPKGLPSWPVQDRSPREYVREHNEMPGYRFNIHELLTITPLTSPTNTQLLGIAPDQLLWFEETPLPTNSTSTPAHRSSRYGLRQKEGQTDVVYAEQCLTQQLCLSWQRWPVITKPMTGTLN